MYIHFFYLLFLMASGAFIASFIFKQQDNKLLFSVLSVILFAALALGSFGLESVTVVVVGTEVIEQITVTYSPSFAYVCIMFLIISLIQSAITAFDSLKGSRGNNKNDI